jgi:hypothetical protein
MFQLLFAESIVRTGEDSDRLLLELELVNINEAPPHSMQR